MANITVIDLNTKIKTQQEVTDAVFAVPFNEDLISQYVYIYRSNHRQGTSASKNRSQVSGGGKKPWRQKGTGRARAGSSRSPIWVHGGVAHGPKPRSWVLSFPKKMKQLVIKIVLSFKVLKSQLYVLKNLKLEKPSTKTLLNVLLENKFYGKNLLVISDTNPNIIKSSANVRDLRVAQASNLNAYDVMLAKNVLFVEDALEKFIERFEL